MTAILAKPSGRRYKIADLTKHQVTPFFRPEKTRNTPEGRAMELYSILVGCQIWKIMPFFSKLKGTEIVPVLEILVRYQWEENQRGEDLRRACRAIPALLDEWLDYALFLASQEKEQLA